MENSMPAGENDGHSLTNDTYDWGDRKPDHGILNPHEDHKIYSHEQLEQLLSEISMVNTALDFKWHFQSQNCLDPDMPGFLVRVGFERPDTNTGEIGTGYGRYEYIGIGTTESGVVKTAWLLIELVVRHELMEAFRWRDKRIFNPHNSIYDLASIQG
jgi:hypothetical protein